MMIKFLKMEAMMIMIPWKRTTKKVALLSIPSQCTTSILVCLVFGNLYDILPWSHIYISAVLQQFSSDWEGKMVYLEAETTFGNQKRGKQTFLGYVQAPVDLEQDPEEIEEVRLDCPVILCTVQIGH
jgi:hypothetical protein